MTASTSAPAASPVTRSIVRDGIIIGTITSMAPVAPEGCTLSDQPGEPGWRLNATSGQFEPPAQLRYVVVERGVVTGAYVASSPESVSAGPDAQVIAHDAAGPGWTWTRSAGFRPPPAPSPSLDAIRHAIGAHVDGVAQARGYDSGVSCAGYAASTVPQWAQEAQVFIAWRDAVWAGAIAMLASVQGGQAEPPSSIEAAISALPAIQWPET